uniref:Glycosyltransferase n=1 Tax=Panax ginseng TaxID=4054 RepID=A0A7G3KHF2_PANGI|nr:UGT75W1 [Panax ginseng]
MKSKKHFLLLSLPVQSHINPTLQLAKILTRSGANVTYATTTTGLGRLGALPTIDGLSYATFSDGKEHNGTLILDDYLAVLKRVAPQSVTKLLQDLSTKGTPVTFIVYTVVLPWVAEVARDINLPSAFLFIQCATAFSIFHRFFNSQDGLHDGVHDISPDVSVQLPGLPLFTCKDIPDFVFRHNQYYSSMVPVLQEHIQTLEKDPNPFVLVNTFDALEGDIIKSFPNMKLLAIGPLLPSAFSDGNDLDDKSFGGTLFKNPNNYLTWLDSKPDESVIYASFGSIVQLQETQKEEILHGLMTSNRPFLWVIRDINEEEVKSMKLNNGIADELGFIVPWCSQVEVLCHRSIGCFVTHCGWNSTVESIIGGVPMVGCPQFSEQKTNINMVEQVWGNGIRVKENDEGVFGREEIRRCLDIVMGEEEKGKEIRRNAMKWKCLAVEAVKEGGSSHNNVKQFLEM